MLGEGPNSADSAIGLPAVLRLYLCRQLTTSWACGNMARDD